MTDIRRRSRVDRREMSEEVDPASERRSFRARELSIHVERKSDKVIVIHMVNEFVAENSYHLDEALGRLAPLESGLRIELDMSHVPYADSEAVGRLISWSKKLAHSGATLVIVNPTPYVTGILEILRVEDNIPVVRKHSFPGEIR